PGTGIARWVGSATSNHVSNSSNITDTVSGTFHCTPRARFTGDQTDEMRFEDFRDFDVFIDEQRGTLAFDRGRVYMLTGIKGKMQGLGERAWVGHDENDPNPSIYLLRSMVGDLFAKVIGFGMLYPSSAGMKYYSEPVSGDEFEAKLVLDNGEHNNEYVVTMGPLDSTFCYLTEISGRFDGGRERIQVVANNHHWQLKVRAAPGKEVRGRARCVYYQQ
ncbi:hypothetical protein, partial [Lujinxingia sediminis]